jgi:hypothetical protein
MLRYCVQGNRLKINYGLPTTAQTDSRYQGSRLADLKHFQRYLP